MSKGLPSTLYKYKTVDQNSLDMLLTGKIWCADPLTFNDPLDCSPTVNIEGENWKSDANYASFLLNYSYLKEKLIELLGEHSFSNKIKNMLEDIKMEKAEETIVDHNIHDYEEFLSKQLICHLNPGVFSLSEDVKSSVMWSHYADEHRGFCIGYATHPTLNSKIHKVNYTNDPLCIDLHDLISMLDDPACYLEASRIKKVALLHKTKHWSYEQEWRYIAESPGLRDTELKISDLTFGLRCKDSIQKMLIDHLKGSGIKFFKIYRIENSNELGIKEI